jgi:hypothetical protein
MPQYQRDTISANQEMTPTLRKLDVIDKWLQKMLAAFPAKGELTPEEIQDWHRDLNPFSEAAIDYAFECHRRTAIFFPMYGQIIDICVSFEPPNQTYKPPTREDISRYGTQYDVNDFLWILIKLRAPCVVGPVSDMRKTAPTAEEWNKLLDECDRKRTGGAPQGASGFRR